MPLTVTVNRCSTQAIYIRHDFKAEDIAKDLWGKWLIAMHFDKIPWIKPEDYQQSEGRVSIKRLLKYCDAGVVVGETYRSAHPEQILIGAIAAGSKINPERNYRSSLRSVRIWDTLI
jgi:hypothetical protein